MKNRNVIPVDEKFLMPVLAILFICLFSSVTLRAEDKPSSEAQPLVLETPERFIERNRAAAEKKLARLKEQSRECGSDLLLKKENDVGKISDGLSVTPQTIRYVVSDISQRQNYEREVKAATDWMKDSEAVFIKDFGLSLMRMGTGFPASPEIRALFPEGMEGVDSETIFAADGDTALILNLPYLCNPVIRASLGRVDRYKDEGCCRSGKQLLNSEGEPEGIKCLTRYDRWTISDKNSHGHRQGLGLPFQLFSREFPMLRVSLSGDRPTGPGINKVTVTASTYIPKMETLDCYFDNKGKLDIYRVEAIVGYKDGPEIRKELSYLAIKFVGLGFPDFGEDSTLDQFGAARVPKIHGGLYESFKISENISTNNLKPKLMIDTGKGIKYIDTVETGKRYLDYMNPFNIAIRTETVESEGGIFQAMGNNRIARTGEVGKGKIKWTAGKLEGGKRSITREITANVVDVVPEATLKDGIISNGGNYRLFVSVKGPADMSQYRVRWHVEGNVRFDSENSSFTKKAENYWVSENMLIADKQGAADMTSEFDRFSLSAEIVNTTGSLFTYNAKGKIRASLMDELYLFAARGKETPHRVPDGEAVDIFSGGRNSRTVELRFLPYVATGDESFKPLPEVYDKAEMYNVKTKAGIRSSDPYTVRVAAGPDGFQAVPGSTGTGSADIYAWVGRDINPDHTDLDNDKVIISKPVTITNNIVMLEAGKGEKEDERVYYLRVVGPADMSRYKAVWAGNKGIDTEESPFKMVLDGGYVAEWTSPASEPLLGVSIVKDETGVFSYSSMMPRITPTKPDIKLIPSNPPVKVAWKQHNNGQAATSSVNVTGLDNDLSVEVLNDSMLITAEIRNLHPEDMGFTFCYWQLFNGDGLTLKSDMTPVMLGKDGNGTSQNIISGLSTGFNTSASIQVDLVTRLTNSGKPVFTDASDQAVAVPVGYPR